MIFTHANPFGFGPADEARLDWSLAGKCEHQNNCLRTKRRQPEESNPPNKTKSSSNKQSSLPRRPPFLTKAAMLLLLIGSCCLLQEQQRQLVAASSNSEATTATTTTSIASDSKHRQSNHQTISQVQELLADVEQAPARSSIQNNSNNTSRSSQQNSWLERNVSESRLVQSSLLPSDQFVAGGASSLWPSSSTQRPPQTRSQRTGTPINQQQRGRLVDRIAFLDQRQQQQQVQSGSSSTTDNKQAQQAAATSGGEKLDYIIEFMRQNKLSKFCDLLTNQAQNNNNNHQIQSVIRQLNSMGQFTLFVPTNEALLLQAPGNFFEQILSKPDEAAKFLLSHATNELVVPKNNNGSQAQGQLVLSLAQTPLRIVTLSHQPAQLTSGAPMSGNRLELIVNGANVIPGHSYALQEPNNSNSTHAIVHLIDRSLYPPPSENLLEMVRQVAPTMASLIDLGSQTSSSVSDFRRAFREPLESSSSAGNSATLFAPNEEAFRATPAKLMDQLHTNRTFLQQFLKAHLLDGLYFNGQLAALNAESNPKSIYSIGGERLEFEAKNLQNRQLVVVNSVPIVVSDLVATNGVLHLLSRPLFPANLLDDCKCGQISINSGSSSNAARPDSASSSRGLRSSFSRASPGGGGDSLEREESAENHQLLRAQRSNGKLPIGPDRNRDFYRPSIAPANLKLIQPSQESEFGSSPIGGAGGGGPSGVDSAAGGPFASLGDNRKPALGAIAHIIPHQPIQLASEPTVHHQADNQQQQQQAPLQLQPLPAVPKYEVTLNATSRLRLRAEQQRAPSNLQNNQNNPNLFAYDQPLAANKADTNSSKFAERLKRPYLAGVVELVPVESSGMKTNPEQQHQEILLLRQAPAPSSNQEELQPAKGADFLSRGESAKREQRLLKFQPEDGRDSLGKTNATSKQHPVQATAIKNMQSNSQLQAAYDYLSAGSTSAIQTNQNQNQNLNQVQLQKLHRQSVGPLSCAFYDSECRRLMGRLVRLPPNGRAGKLAGLKQNPTIQQNATAAYDTTFGEATSMAPINYLNNANGSSMGQGANKPMASLSGLKQATVPPSSIARDQAGPPMRASLTAYSSTILGQPRLSSVLNQPLPPLSLDEANLRQLSSAHLWRTHDAEINRIPQDTKQQQDQRHLAAVSGRLLDNKNFNQPQVNYGHGFTSGISRTQANNSLQASGAPMTFELPRASPSAPLRQAQILFVPVKLVNASGPASNFDSGTRNTRFMNISSSSSGDSLALNLPENVLIVTPSNSNSNFSTSSTPIPFESPATTHSTQSADGPAFKSRHQYLTPMGAGQQLQQQQQHHHPNHQYHSTGSFINQHHQPASSRSNLTLADDSSEFGFDAPMGADLGNNSSAATNQAAKQVNQQQKSSPLVQHLTPADVAHRKHMHQQNGMLFFGGGGGGLHATSSSGVKWPGGQQPQQQISPDFSVTSARLTDNNAIQLMLSGQAASHNATTGAFGGLATQASDQQQQLHHSAPQPTSADYFQDRTIGEIMDDSGLRIDGQLVTFRRLKQCLGDANLLSLASQTGNSLTMFMPTDQAFQRLVQVAFGQRQQAAAASPFSGRLSSAQSQSSHLPLVVRAPPADDSITAVPTTANPAASGDSAAGVVMSSLGAIDRLTLDCQTPVVRQMLLDHISARLITPKELAQDTSISSLSGRQLILSSVPSKQIVVVDGQPVLAATRAKNGMVYVINKFLNLTNQMATVVDLMQTQPELSTFVGYMRLGGNQMGERLKREAGPLTVLAPTNDAFEQLSPAARQLINSDPSALMDILRGHVLDGAQFGKLISMRSRLNTMNRDQKIEAKVIKPNVYMLDNQMTSMRLVGTAGNGVVNAIDRLIVPAWLRVSMSSGSSRSAPSNSLDTSATVDSGAALLARQAARLHQQQAATPPNGVLLDHNNGAHFPTVVNVQPELLHGNADTIFRNSNSNSNSNNLNSLNRRPLDGTTTLPANLSPASSSAFNVENLSRLKGDNFLKFASNNRHLANASASSSSSLAGDFNGPDSNGPSSLGFSGNSNELGGPTAINNASSLVRHQSASITSKNMQLIEKLANLMQAKKFLKFLLNSKVHELLKPDMNYVILVPTDQAIERLPGQILSLLDHDSERLSDLINYHIIDTTFDYINTIPDGQTLQTLNEKDILFNWHRNNSILTVSGAIVLGGIQEENIALLIVDRVLYPTPGDLLAIVNKSPILSNFTTIIRNAGLDNQLSRAGPFTLFAPSDAAFSQLDKSDLDFLQRNKEIARRFLLRHLSSPMIFTSSIALSSNMTTSRFQHLVPSINITNSLGEDLTLRQRNDYFSVNDINFSYADVAASNGVLHVIDGLL